MRVSPFEHQLIHEALAQSGPPIAVGTALVLMPDLADFLRVFEEAISPALRDCDFKAAAAEPAFDSRGWLGDVSRWVMGAEIIIADVTQRNPDVMYTLGLCHGLGRCPLLIAQDPEQLPFNVDKLRCIPYVHDGSGLRTLRERLARAVRVFVAEANASFDRRTPS
jgi:hypothetical protein